MLLKDLKAVLHEADEPTTDNTKQPAKDEAAASSAEQPIVPKKGYVSYDDYYNYLGKAGITPKIPKKFIDLKKELTDGVGEETYKISNAIADNLTRSLTMYFNINKVETNKNVISLVSPIDSLKDGKITNSRTNEVVDDETLLDTIQQIINAGLGKKVNMFTLVGPKTVAPGIMIIAVLTA